MNKGGIVSQMAKEAKITKRSAEKAVNSLLGSITKSLKKGEKVTLVGFGTFAVRKRAARKGRNPQTGAEIKIGAKKVPVFKAGQKLKNAVK